MAKISSYGSNKAEGIQALMRSERAVGVAAGEGSLMEEFSQILDKIAEHLAGGHKDAESMDLLAIEQAAERVQVELSAQQNPRPVSSEAKDQIVNEDGAQVEERSEETAAEVITPDMRSPDRGLGDEQAASPEEMSDLLDDASHSLDNKQVGSDDSQEGEVPTDLVKQDEAQLSGKELQGNEDGGYAVSSEEPVPTELPAGGDPLPQLASAEPSSMKVMTAGVRQEQSSETGVERSQVLPVTGPVAPQQSVTPLAEQKSLLSTLSAQVERESSVRLDPGVKSGASEKAIPFTAFMLQGQGIVGGGLSRDVVAQSILRTTSDSSHGRNVGELAAGSRASMNGNMNGDPALMRNPSDAAKGDVPARALKSLGKVAVLRTLEKVERALEEVARSKDGKTISLHLEPVTLGKVKVDVSLKDGNLHARLSAESVEVQNLLREHAHELQAILRRTGVHVDSVSVSVSSDNGSFQGSTELFERQQDPARSGVERGETQGEVPHEVAENGARGAVVEDHWIA